MPPSRYDLLQPRDAVDGASYGFGGAGRGLGRVRRVPSPFPRLPCGPGADGHPDKEKRHAEERDRHDVVGEKARRRGVEVWEDAKTRMNSLSPPVAPALPSRVALAALTGRARLQRPVPKSARAQRPVTTCTSRAGIPRRSNPDSNWRMIVGSCARSARGSTGSESMRWPPTRPADGVRRTDGTSFNSRPARQQLLGPAHVV
jgi:hypothetical protein